VDKKVRNTAKISRIVVAWWLDESGGYFLTVYASRQNQNTSLFHQGFPVKWIVSTDSKKAGYSWQILL
jgi:hypothetical protein